MAFLSDHVNVYSSCIALLDLQGWKIEIEPGPYEKEDASALSSIKWLDEFE